MPQDSMRPGGMPSGVIQAPISDPFRALAATALDGIITADDQGRITYANPSAQRMFGYAQADLVGAPLTQLMPDRFRLPHEEGFARYLAGGAPRFLGGVAEVAGRRRDGTEFPVELSLSAWGRDGRVHFTGIIRDISDRKQFEKAEARLAARAELAAQAVRAISLAGTAHEGFAALAETLAGALDFSRGSFAVRESGRGFRMSCVWGPEGWRFPAGQRFDVESDSLWSRYQAGRGVVSSDTADRSLGADDDRGRRVGIRSYVSVPVIAAGEVQALLSFSSLQPGAFGPDSLELMERMAREAAGLLFTLLLLDRERKAAARLAELDRLKDEFIGVVAHELRTPMTVIAGFARTLRTDGAGMPGAEREHLLDLILGNTDQLSALASDVLEVARIESGSVEYELAPFDLGALVKRTATEMSVTQPRRRVLAEVPAGLPPALGDEGRCWQVLTNLLANAFKFSPEPEPVTVGAGVDDGELRVRVSDRGPGIEAADLPALFGKFSRPAPSDGSQRLPGTGLGLYICKQLVEGQQGRIWAESAPGQGTTFTFTLPRLGSRPAARKAGASGAHRPRVSRRTAAP